jgi:hypothetical protein
MMKVQTESLGQWLLMPIRYDAENLKFYVMFGEERIEDPNYQKLMGILSAMTLEGRFSDMESEQKERMRKRMRAKEA